MSNQPVLRVEMKIKHGGSEVSKLVADQLQRAFQGKPRRRLTSHELEQAVIKDIRSGRIRT